MSEHEQEQIQRTRASRDAKWGRQRRRLGYRQTDRPRGKATNDADDRHRDSAGEHGKAGDGRRHANHVRHHVMSGNGTAEHEHHAGDREPPPQASNPHPGGHA
jgi:hypothetical protein